MAGRVRGAWVVSVLLVSSGCADAWHAVRGTVRFREGSEVRPFAGAIVEVSPPPGQKGSHVHECTEAPGPMSCRAVTKADGQFEVFQHCFGAFRARCGPAVLLVSAPGYESRVVELRDEHSGARPCPSRPLCVELEVLLERAAASPR
jgi:hypothetical protein